MSHPILRSFAALAVVLTATACGRAPANEAERLDQAMHSASQEYGVPQALLESIGYSETRWWMRPGVASIDQGYGVMHLVDAGEDGPLAKAARLTGYTKDQLKTDVEANVRGAAAVLRDEADRYFKDAPAKDERDLSTWWQVVMRYSGAWDAEAADNFATAVYLVVNRGARGLMPDGSEHFYPPTPVEVSGEKLFGSMPQALTPDYAGAHWNPAASNNYTPASRPPTINTVVIHTMQGSYTGSINWFKNPAAQVSAHYCVSSGGDVTQMVQDKDIAWHAGNWTVNTQSIGIEHEGYVDQPSYMTEAMYQASANLTRWLCNTYGIPKDRHHIIGHYEVPGCTGSFGGGSGCHTDPCVNGSQCYWNWNHYMDLVGGTPPPPSSGTLKGFVYSSANGCTFNGSWSSGCLTKDSAGHYTNVVPGARVYLPENGFAMNADQYGYFEFNNVPFGTYHPSGSAPGYADSGPVLGARTLDANHTLLYSSFILNKLATTGNVKGVVYVVNPQNAADKSQKLDGALVNTGTNTVSAGSDGSYQLNGVAQGNQSISAAKDGYKTATATINVVAGQTVTLDLGLVPTDSTPPVVTIATPMNDVVVGYMPITLSGTVTDTDDSITTVKVGTQDVPVTDGKFTTSLTLDPGEHVVTVTATDAAGNQGTANVAVTYDPNRTGLSGKVLDAVSGKPVASAVVTSGTAFFKTLDDGVYALDLPAGSASVAVQAAGYIARTVTVTVLDGQRTTADIYVVPTGGASALVTITAPANNATVSTPTVTVTGKSHIPHLAALKVNDADAQVAADGSFTAQVTLTEGSNTLIARGKSTDGLEASAQVTVTYAPLAKTKAGGCGCSGGLDFSLLALLGVGALARRRKTNLA